MRYCIAFFENRNLKFTFDKQFDEASVGSSITIELENDINVTRGDMIVKSSELPKIEKISIQQCVGWTVKKFQARNILCNTILIEFG
jgi:sulfate adenylyltransferase subunit 1 (EFTu-like GTPase family)